MRAPRPRPHLDPMPVSVPPAGADAGDTRTPPHVGSIEAARRDLGLSDDEIAAAVGANASTLNRWRAGETAASPADRGRLTALAERTAALRGVLARAGVRESAVAAGARAWLDGAGPDVPGLAEARPRTLLAAGEVERLATLLTQATPDAGAPTPATQRPAPIRPAHRTSAASADNHA